MTAAALGALVMLPAAPASAQSIEISGFGGYTFSEGIKTDPGRLVGAVIDKVNPTSGPSYGVGVDVFLSDVASIGFRWGRQDSNLEVTGTTTRELTSMTLSHYHGVYTYHLGSSDMVQPFFFGGAGITDVSFGNVMGFPIEGDSRFSTTWGGGVKVFPTSGVGLNLTGRWTPTYIKSDPAGVYCSPYWSPYYPGGCAVLSEPDYMNQFELSAGINFRF